jgi:hypothetical protein
VQPLPAGINLIERFPDVISGSAAMFSLSRQSRSVAIEQWIPTSPAVGLGNSSLAAIAAAPA